MENASKALVIAAAALIGILLASLMVFAFRTFGAHSARITKDMNKNKITEFNQKFLNFETPTKITWDKEHKYPLNLLSAQDVKTIINLNESNIEKGEMSVDIVLSDEEHTPTYTADELRDFDVYEKIKFKYTCVVEYGTVEDGTQEYVKKVTLYGTKYE